MKETLDKNTKYYRIVRSNDILLNKEFETNKVNKTWDSLAKKEKEDRFEKYRLENLNSLPSRRTSLFICSKKHILIWIKKLGLKDVKKVLQMELSGVVFWADSQEFDEDFIVEYWNGCGPVDERCVSEGLFEGTYKAIKDCTAEFIK